MNSQTTSLKLLSFAAFFLISILAIAQESDFYVISCTGSCLYFESDSDEGKKIIPGQHIHAKGKIVVENGASAKLLCAEKPQIIEPGEHDLAELYDANSSKSMSFTGKFWKFVQEGLQKSDKKEDLIKYHKQHMSVSGGVRGYSPESNQLVIVEPFGDKITESEFRLSWIDSLTSEKTTVHILDSTRTDTLLILSAKPHQNEISFDISDVIPLESDFYIVIVKNASNLKSERLYHFTSVNQSKLDRRISSLIDIEKSNAKEKAWISAVVLEMEGYPYAANLKYQELLESYPEDGHLQKMYVLFLARNSSQESLTLTLSSRHFNE